MVTMLSFHKTNIVQSKLKDLWIDSLKLFVLQWKSARIALSHDRHAWSWKSTHVLCFERWSCLLEIEYLQRSKHALDPSACIKPKKRRAKNTRQLQRNWIIDIGKCRRNAFIDLFATHYRVLHSSIAYARSYVGDILAIDLQSPCVQTHGQCVFE